MIKHIPNLINALKSSASPKILGRYRGTDWTEYVVPHNRFASVDIINTKAWFLTIHQWPPLVDMQVAWWEHYKHSAMALHNPLVMDNDPLRKYAVRTVDFEVPRITSPLMEHNYSLHLFSRHAPEESELKCKSLGVTAVAV